MELATKNCSRQLAVPFPVFCVSKLLIAGRIDYVLGSEDEKNFDMGAAMFLRELWVPRMGAGNSQLMPS
jgi:hypothetical protein